MKWFSPVSYVSKHFTVSIRQVKSCKPLQTEVWCSNCAWLVCGAPLAQSPWQHPCRLLYTQGQMQGKVFTEDDVLV